MARRKRASMREGPLADLFRSTSGPEEAAGGEGEAEEHPTELIESEGAEAPPPVEERPTDVERTPGESEPVRATEQADQPSGGEPSAAERGLPEADEVSVYRLDEPPASVDAPRDARERLRNVFVDEKDPEGPAFGRDEPGTARAPAPAGVNTPVIRVIGVGGAGVNAINRMVEAGITGVEFLAINTDLQSLQTSTADVTVHIGGEVTRGLGSGSDPLLGYKAAFAEQDKIKRLLKGSDMVFIAAGVGGGTGTGAAPVIARLAQTVGALTVGIVTKPFGFEGSRRAKQAEEGLDALSAEVDTLIIIPNERLLTVLSRNTSMVQAFQVADDVLRQGVQGIADLVTLPALINLDFADVRTTMRDAGQAILGIGMGTGDSRALFAAQRAISSPLLETSIDGARSILLSITGGRDLSLMEVSEAAKVIQEAAHPDANIIFGANVDEELDEQVWVTVIATRFDGRGRRADGGSRGSERAGTAGRELPGDRPRRGRDDARPGDLGIEAPEFDVSR
jgi:cell division protein FtsZ